MLIVWWRGERKRRRRRSCSSSRLIGMGSSNFQHGSREELNLFQPLFETRQRLQFLSSEIRLQAPNPPTIGGSKPENKVLILETQDDCGSDTAVASLLNNSTASFSFHTAAPTVEDSVDGNDVEPDGGTQHEQPPDNEHTHLGRSFHSLPLLLHHVLYSWRLGFEGSRMVNLCAHKESTFSSQWNTVRA